MTWPEVAAIVCGSGGLSAALNIAVSQLTLASSKRRDAVHQALLVAEHLEAFAFGCAGSAFATWSVVAQRTPGALLGAVPAFPPFSDKIVWQSLDPGNAARARQIASAYEIGNAQTITAFGRSPASGYRFAFAETLRLGNDAYETASHLRRLYDLPDARPVYPRWDYVEFLVGELEKLPARREQITTEANLQSPT